MTPSTYDGAPCKHCGETLRYIKDDRCIPCTRSRMLERYHNRDPQIQTARQIAKKSGEMFYEGLPCKRCKATKRYTVTKKCVACNRNTLTRDLTPEDFDRAESVQLLRITVPPSRTNARKLVNGKRAACQSCTTPQSCRFCPFMATVTLNYAKRDALDSQDELNYLQK